MFFNTSDQKINIKKLFVLIALGVAFCMLFISLPTVQNRIQMAQSNITNYRENINKDTSIGYRFQLYQMGLHIVKHHFLIGIEQHKETYLGAVPEVRDYVKTGKVSKWVLRTSHFHNDLLQQFVYRGILGFLSVLFIFILPFLSYLKAVKKDKEKRIYAFMGMILTAVFFIAGQTEPFFRHQGLMNFYTIYTCFFLAAISKQSENKTKLEPSAYK
jgi:O-antigen ligase